MTTLSRRSFLASSLSSCLALTAGAAAGLQGAPALSQKDRVDRALKGQEVDRPAFSLWHHFGLKTADEHARRTLEFHRDYRTDLVKVMSDFPYPKAQGKWYEVRPESNPFPDQIAALRQIRDGLAGRAYFVETIFNSWNVAQKLSSKEELGKFRADNPAALLQALETINNSQIRHAKLALDTGAAGILLAVANANAQEMSKEDYRKFSEPFDRKLLQSVSGAKLNILHLHVDRDYLDAVAGIPATVVNYSLHVTGIPLSEARTRYPGRVLMGGIDERNYASLTRDQIREQSKAAQRESGPRFLLSPGCSVPNDSQPEALSRLALALGA